MDSQVVKELQKLHFRDKVSGLEDVFQLDNSGLVSSSDFRRTPVSPRHLPLLGKDLKESVNLKKPKTKLQTTDDYYYKSPCPEKQTRRNSSPTKAYKPRSGTGGLIEKAAEFCKENEVDGFGCKIFVGNISYRVKDLELREFFNLFGKVIRANVCKDKKTKRSRGFGFVIFSNRDEAEAAIHAKDYQLTLEGRLLQVSWAERRRKDKAKDNSGLPAGQCLQDLALSFLENENNENLPELEDIEDPERLFINQLDDDMLINIFSYLDLKEKICIERVCRRWRSLCLQTWRSLTFLSFNGMFTLFKGAGGLTDQILHSMLKKGCTNLQILDLSASPYLLTSHGLFTIGNICVELRHLNMTGVAVNNNNLKDIGKRCQHLETMVLGRCRDFGEKGLWWFLKEAKNLKRLEVTDNVRINGKCFWMLPESCKELILTDCVKISDSGLENVSNKSPFIDALDLSNCPLVSDVGLAKICTNCLHLRKLSIPGAGPGVTSQGLISIGSLENLEYLNISQNQTVNDAAIYHIAQCCKKLQCLNLEACHGAVTDTGLKYLSALPGLKDLNISYLTEITDAALGHLAANSRLRSILCRACSKLTNEALISLLLFNGDSLAEIDFSGCFHIDDTLLSHERLSQRDDHLHQLSINLGGTSLTPELAVTLQKKIGNCVVLLEKRYNSRLRGDNDPTVFAPFDSSDEDDTDFQDDAPFHPFSARGYTVRSSDLQDQKQLTSASEDVTIEYPGPTDDQIEDFLDADDPALMDELEDQFMFD